MVTAQSLMRGDEVQAESEWIRNSVMIVTDEDSNEYEMEAQ